MSDKISVTETQLLLIDLLGSLAIRYMTGEIRRIMNASEQELIEIQNDIDARFNTAIDKIKAH